VLSSIATNSWYSSYRDRHHASAAHKDLLKSQAFLKYAESIFQTANERVERALIAEPAARMQLKRAYASVNAFASAPGNALRWADQDAIASVRDFNSELLESMKVDVNDVLSSAQSKDERLKGGLLAVAATAKGATALQQSQAAEALAKTHLALGDWAAAQDSVQAAAVLVQAIESKEQREAILMSAYSTGGWAAFQLGENEKGTGLILNAMQLGNKKAFDLPMLLDGDPRSDSLGALTAKMPNLDKGG
jgi:hypothetical protein